MGTITKIVDAAKKAAMKATTSKAQPAAKKPKVTKTVKHVQHDSDCATHNGPAYEPGPCDCSVSDAQRDDRKPNYGRSPTDTSEIDALRQEPKRNTLRHPWRKPQA
jgi:hypothetical protein